MQVIAIVPLFWYNLTKAVVKLKKQNKLNNEQILSILSQYSKQLKLTENEVKLNTDIVDIKFLGTKQETIQIDGYERKIDKYIFLVEKEMDVPGSKNKERITRKEYYEESDLLAVEDEKFDKFGLIPAKEHMEKESIEDLEMLIENNPNPKSLSELENERIKKLAKLLNKKPEELKATSEIDVNSPILNPEQTDGKTELKLDEKITQTETFADIVPGVKKYKRVIVDYSERVKGGSGKFSFIGIDEKGNKEVIDSLIPTQGTNPTNDIVTIDRNGDNVEQEQVSSLYRVKGRPDEGFSFKLDEYGIPKVSYVRGIESKEYLAGQVQTTNLKPTTLEVKNMMDKTKNTSVIDEVGKAKKEIESNDKNTNIKNIDENPNNDIEI